MDGRRALKSDGPRKAKAGIAAQACTKGYQRTWGLTGGCQRSGNQVPLRKPPREPSARRS